MSGFRNLCIAVTSAALLAMAADSAADLVLGKVRAGIVSDVADARGVACMESVERTRYAPRIPNTNPTCAEVLAATARMPGGSMEWRSRLRLDVTAGAAAEEFALTEASSFERKPDPDAVAGILRAASAGQGEFSTFLRNLTAVDGDSVQSRGLEQTPSGRLQAFGFTMPGGYRGSLFAIPASGDLKRLTLERESDGEACRVQYAIDYASTRVGDREIVLPQSSTMDAVNRNGTELRSETYFSGCRRPGVNAPVSLTDPPKPLPPGVRLRVRFQTPIDIETAATGDPVIGVIRATVKDKQNGIVVHAGDRLHGRIALIEQYLSPQPRWNLAIVFATIERGVGDHGIDQGVEQPVSLISVDNKPPGGDTAGAAYFVFAGQEVVLDQKLETEWETR